MFHIDFIIGNTRHHCEMAAALARWMGDRGGYELRVLSLCEFWGNQTPSNPLGTVEAEIVKISKFQRPRWGTPKRKGRISKVARAIAWYAVLESNVNSTLSSRPDLVILFNDCSYPNDRICAVLRNKGIPFLLVQEGIRFETDASARDGAHVEGRGGAHAIAVFGESSAQYFQRRGVPRETIHLTGNPRFDQIRTPGLELRARQINSELGLGRKNLLFLSNPIEFFGYCSVEEKLKLVRDFVLGIDALFEDDEFHLLFKLHTHENSKDFHRAIKDSPHVEKIVIASHYDLYPLLTLSQGAVIFGTTAGLEALLFDVPLGVLEIPGTGYLYDYVAGGAALGIRWDGSLPDQVAHLLEQKAGRPYVEQYMERTLAVRNGSTERVGDLIDCLVRRQSGPLPPRS